MNIQNTTPKPQVDAETLIIGTGFSGLGLAVILEREGTRDYLMLERGQDVGGTWRDNHYPGAGCDVFSHLYSYSFRPNPHWSRTYSKQPEILKYLQDTAKDEGVYPKVRFGTTVTRADWIEEDGLWQVETNNGTYRARALVSATGHLSDLAMPDIEGLESFGGKMMHSSQWDHDYDYTGKRVGIIGTGASSIQIAPEIAPDVSHLTVFQRTAPYIVPRRDEAYSEAQKGMFERFPEMLQDFRKELFWGNESRFPQRLQIPAFLAQIQEMSRGHLEAQVADPELREKLTPPYSVGCKRILISNEYYPAIQRENVTLETTGIARIDETGVLLTDGSHVELDMLILATGFEATELPIAEVIYGKTGRLSDQWENGGQAFACTSVHGYPNFFMMLGPNTGLGAGSMIYMVETQIEYIRGALEYLFESGKIIEPDREAQEAYVKSIHDRAERTVWITGGCQSWYLHPRSGKLTAIWPDYMSQFRKENGTFATKGYMVRDVTVPA